MIDAARRAAVFVDKDGTLIDDVPYNVDPALVRFSRHAIAGLQMLAHHGFALFVVTNQSGLASGRFTHDAYRALRCHIEQRLHGEGIALQGWYTCPHARDAACGWSDAHGAVAPCACRKPAPGLLRRAAEEHGIDLAQSWMIGDILDDIEAGRRAGCRTVLLDVGNETVWRRTPLREPHHRCADLLAAAQTIVAQHALQEAVS